MRFSLYTLLTILLFTSTGLSQSVDPLTGRLQFSIPITTLQANDIAIPISIYHHGGALAVPEGEGACGLGWNLSVGGSISRMVRGLPDEINLTNRKGWLFNSNAQAVQNFNPTANDDFTDCADESADYNLLNALVGGAVNDTEPDIFYISAPGVSAQFVFGPDGLPKLLVHQDIVIEYTGGNFIVKSNGKVYTFDTREIVMRTSTLYNAGPLVHVDFRYYSGGISYTSRWNLSNITSTASGTQAYFSYAPLTESRSRSYLTLDSSNFIEDKFTPLRIGLIMLKSYAASFIWHNDLLTKVAITETESSDKLDCQLVYTSVSGPEVWLLPPLTKSLLTKVFLVNNSPFAKYEFEYNNLPNQVWRRNWSMDYFGYYNGIALNKNDPTLYFYSSETDGRRLRVTQIPGGNPLLVAGSDRSVDPLLSASGSLKKIILPTGGNVSIEYEANTYMDNSTSQELSGGGVRVKKLTSQGGEIAFGKSMDTGNAYRAITKEYEYKLANNNSSGVLLSPIKLGFIISTGVYKSVYDQGENAEILYTRVKEKINGQGSKVSEFSIPGVFPEIINGDWKASKSRIARKPGGSCIAVGNIKNGYYTFPYAPSTNYGHKRGFLTRVSEHSESGILIREKIFTPIELSSGASTIKGLRFEESNDIFQYGIYEMLTGRVQVIGTEVTRETSEENPSLWMQTTTQYTYNTNNMLQVVTTTLPDNTVTINRMKYAKDFQYVNPVSTDTMAVALKKLNDTNRQGEIVEQIRKMTMPGVPETVSSNLILYRDFGGNRVLPYYVKTLPVGAALTEAAVSGQNFVADIDYQTVRTLKEYDNESRLLTEVDDKRNYAAYHYGVNPSFQVATFANAKAQQAIYEGFELTTSYGLTASGFGITYPAGWTGEKAVQFSNNTAKLISSATNLIQKAGNSYRVSCWLYSVANKTVTISAKSGGTTVSVVLTNLQNNVWNYVEGTLNIASITGPFTLEVSTNATASQLILVDDLVFIPTNARIAFQTSKALTGVTSITDDRGNSVKYSYDDAKRLVYTYDRDRNAVSKNEYSTKVTTPECVLSANFSKPVSEILVDVPALFTASLTCGSAITYEWQVDGVIQTAAITNNFNYTFPLPGIHNVKLTVTDATFGSATFTETICVGINATITIVDNLGNPVAPTTTFDCNSTNIPLTFSVAGLGSFGTNDIVTWYKLEYNAIRNIYELIPIMLDGYPVTGLSFTTFYPATTTLVAGIDLRSASSSACFLTRVDAQVTINYSTNGNCN